MQAKQYSVQTCNYVSSFRLRSHVKWYCTSYYNSQNLQVFVYFLVSRCLQILNSLPCINIIKILHVIFVLVPSELFYWQLLSVRCTNSILAGRYSLSSTNLCKKKKKKKACLFNATAFRKFTVLVQFPDRFKQTHRFNFAPQICMFNQYKYCV